MLSEKEFLSDYNIEKYARASVAADIVTFMIRTEEQESYRKNPKSELSVLLVKRGVHPFLHKWALPGGFLRADETIEECAMREIIEETNVTPAALMPSVVNSKADRDPRGRIISHSFICIISEDTVNAVGGHDAMEAEWFDLSFEKEGDCFKLHLSNENETISAILKEKSRAFGRVYFETVENGGLAFDHAELIAAALSALREKAKDYDVIFDFLPEKFTLTALQKVQETILNVSMLPANFRRKVAEYVIETEEYATGAGHRPAKLFRRR